MKTKTRFLTARSRSDAFNLRFISLAAVAASAACTGSVGDEGTGATSEALCRIGAVCGRPDPIPVPPPPPPPVCRFCGSIPIDPLPQQPLYADGTFYLRGLGNRCWDFGGQAYWSVGAPVYLYSCNGSVAQQVRIKELDDTHDVELRVQDLYCLGVSGGKVSLGQALELQTCNGSPAQRFALDGDSVLTGTQASGTVSRDYVIEPVGDVTSLRTPLVVGTRETSDAEYFRTYAVDGSAAKPTSGFQTVSTEADLDLALTLGWGTVIEVSDKQPLVITGMTPKEIHAGVTIRGYRKTTYQGPQVLYPNIPKDNLVIFEAKESHARVTGLRMQGPSMSTDSDPPYVHGIQIIEGNDVLVDHVDGSAFLGAVVNIVGPNADIDQVCPVEAPYPRVAHAQVRDNFFHHNEREGGGYGIAVGNGAFALASGNLMYMNRHSITADGIQTTGYVAEDNFVLSDAPSYGFLGWDHEQDFDKHGTLDPGHWVGGVSDDYVDFGWNTFLGTNRYNVRERGTPCRFTRVHDSVFLEDQGSAITSDTTDASRLIEFGNVFNAANPTDDLAVGDFDGDGIDDVFVGTGTSWWFSSGGQAEWRFLSRKPERTSQLRFGDFDGDGRTDVIARHNLLVDISWGGVSPWQTINTAGFSVTDLAVGDFDGDHNADLFLANGNEWFYAPTGRNWRHFAFSSFRTQDLRFGDFDADGKTDVFGVVGGQWQYVPGGGDSWTPLRTALTSTVNGLVVADFDGDGYPDVARQVGAAWQYAARGWGGFVTLRTAPAGENLIAAQVGKFNGDAKADAVVWNGLHFWVSAGIANPSVNLSRQDMR